MFLRKCKSFRESRMKPSCQKWNAACKDPAKSAGNWEEWTDQDNDVNTKVRPTYTKVSTSYN